MSLEEIRYPLYIRAHEGNSTIAIAELQFTLPIRIELYFIYIARNSFEIRFERVEYFVNI